MNDADACGKVIPVEGLALGTATTQEEGEPPEVRVAIVGITEGGHTPGLAITYRQAWALVKGLLAMLAESNGFADDARRMLHHGQARPGQS